MDGQIDIVSLCLLGILIVVGFMLMTRMMSRAGARGGQGGMPTRGPNRPMADDPNIESRGGFGDQPQRGDGSPEQRGGSLFPQSGASSQSARDENAYPGRRGGSLFPQNDARDDDPPRRDDPPRGGGDKPRNDDPDVDSRGGFGRNK